jgi:hypothetical protein
MEEAIKNILILASVVSMAFAIYVLTIDIKPKGHNK